MEARAGSFDPEILELFDRELEVDVETSREGGPARRTTIWIVVADGVPLVRSWLGERGRWYREIRAEPSGAIHVAGRRIPVKAMPALDAASVEACSKGLEAKYAGDSATPQMVSEAVLGTTLRLEPA